MSNFYAEEHPSDANYLALAGGSAFGVPLTDPGEENPLYTINAPNIGDLVSESGESWKAYTQSANGPCDDTVHGYYWNDDQPMLYFQDVRDRPRYCASHVVPLEELPGDLSNAATTPNFAWIAPDDCADMEGCGIAAGDAFLKAELTLGLGTLTANDRYAQPLNNIFYPEPTLFSAPATNEASAGGAPASAAGTESAAPAPPGTAGFLAAAARARQPVAWVVNYGSNTVSPVDLAASVIDRPGHAAADGDRVAVDRHALR